MSARCRPGSWPGRNEHATVRERRLADKVKRVANSVAVSGIARRNNTIRKQLDAGNTDEQVMRGGDLTRAVEGAEFDLMTAGNDAADADRLLKDRESMRHYAWAVLRLMRSGLSTDELRDLT